MVPDLANPFFARVLSGVEQTAAENGFATLVSDTRDDPMVERSCVEDVAESDSREVPFVHAIENPESTQSPSVCIDNVGASEAIVDYLISLGHRKIGVVAGRKDSGITRHRFRGYMNAKQRANLPVEKTLVAFGDYSLDGGAGASMSLFSRTREVTALFCMSVEIAIGTMSTARRLGIELPTELSITGFDSIAYGKHCHPALTTVTQPAELIGEVAVRLMFELLSEQPTSPRQQVLPTELVIRESAVPVR
jgi:LacI family repressor for deo operon, udp, cdd, tsx, nupC, and nupG